MTDIAIFAAGCFWGIEEKFLSTKGVEETEVGYIGGKTDNPTYNDVCVGDTYHAEAVRIHYNSDEITYDELLDIFLKYTIQLRLIVKALILEHNTDHLFFI